MKASISLGIDAFLLKKMRKVFLFLLLIILLLSNKETVAQYNYVPNPSFEEYDSIPIYNNDSIIVLYYYYPSNWFLPVDCGFCYYFNSKLNYVDTIGGNISAYGVPQNPWSYTYPYEGIAQSSFCPFTLNGNEGIRNYLEVKLKSPLTEDHVYCVSFFITILDTSYISIDQIGACFTIDSLINHTPYGNPPCYLLQNPPVVSTSGYYFNIRNQWQRISGTFIAHGGEQFITVGNFKTDANTNYVWLPDVSSYGPGSVYHIDMVSVIECDSNIIQAQAGMDSIICRGDSIMLGPSDNMNGYEFYWMPGSGLSDSCIKNPIASPTQTTTYIMYQTYFSSDTTTDTVTVTVKVCDESVDDLLTGNKIRINLYPNPAKDLLNIEYTNTENTTGTLQFEIYDLMGKRLRESIVNPNQNTIVSTDALSQGIYLYKFVYKNKIVKKDKLVIIK